MVVSHDCDLANANLDDEPYVEVIAGKRLPSSDPNLANLKSARTLHLTITCEGRTECIELTATGKQLVQKSALAAWRPDPRYRLDADNFFTLRRWLAARYCSAAQIAIHISGGLLSPSADSTTGLDLFQPSAAAFDFGEDVLCARLPDERLGITIPGRDEFLDRAHQVRNAGEAAAPPHPHRACRSSCNNAVRHSRSPSSRPLQPISCRPVPSTSASPARSRAQNGRCRSLSYARSVTSAMPPCMSGSPSLPAPGTSCATPTATASCASTQQRSNARSRSYRG